MFTLNRINALWAAVDSLLIQRVEGHIVCSILYDTDASSIVYSKFQKKNGCQKFKFKVLCTRI